MGRYADLMGGQVSGTFPEIKKFMGCWCVGGTGGMQFWITRRPNWFHQLTVKWMFGWEWKDSPPMTKSEVKALARG